MPNRTRIVRLLCCSDTHGSPPPPVDERGAAAWLHGGDVYEQTSSVDPATVQRGMRRWLDGRSIPVYAVRGNHDKVDAAGVFQDGRDVTGQVRKIAEGLWVAGIGWFGDSPYDVPTENDVAPLCDNIRRDAARSLKPSDRLILLTHYPALLRGLCPLAGYAGGGILDGIRLLIENLKPIAVVQGHVHEWFGMSGVFDYAGGRSLIVNPGPQGALLDLDLASGSASCEFLGGRPG